MAEENNNENEVGTRDILYKAMNQIFKEFTMKLEDYFKFHTFVYDRCVKGKESNVWYQKRQLHNDDTVDSIDELCQLIVEYLNDHIEGISKKMPENEEECLKMYSKEWKNFRWLCGNLNAACRYLNDQLRKRIADSDDVYQMSLKIWRKHLLDDLNAKLSDAALKLLQRSREGEDVETTSIQSVIESYMDLDNIETKDEFSEATTLTPYKDFEKRMLNGTYDYYSRIGESALQVHYSQQKSFEAYMKYIQIKLSEETRRAILLPAHTKDEIMQLCYKALIEKHMHIFQSEFQIYLEMNKLDEMELLCSLAIKSEPVIKRINSIFEDRVRKVGLDEIEKYNTEATEKNPMKYIEKLLSVYEQFNKIIHERFKDEIGMGSALDKACSEFINKNAVTGEKSDNSNRSAELLAFYCHTLLKKSKKCMEDDELEAKLNGAMIVFRFINDKDVFEIFYKRRLAERLILELSASDDAEGLMISKMKQACGYDYTNKLQKMYQDIEVSKNLTEEFRKRNETSIVPLKLDFRIKVLTNGSWPLEQPNKINIPIELTKPIEQFTHFYTDKHSSRKLSWLYKHSKAELLMNGSKKTFYIKVNTFQLAVLLQFNEKLSFTVEQLHENTLIDSEYIKQLVEFLVTKEKILKRNDATETCHYQLNTDYNGLRNRFDISAKPEVVRRNEQSQVNRHIDESRSFMIDAAIVRAMKMRKTMKFQQLIAEVITLLSAKFTPTVISIKRAIEKLIEKEYLERAENQRDTYNYLA